MVLIDESTFQPFYVSAQAGESICVADLYSVVGSDKADFSSEIQRLVRCDKVSIRFIDTPSESVGDRLDNPSKIVNFQSEAYCPVGVGIKISERLYAEIEIACSDDSVSHNQEVLARFSDALPHIHQALVLHYKMIEQAEDHLAVARVIGHAKKNQSNYGDRIRLHSLLPEYGLTRAEIELVAKLFEGECLKSIAACRSVSIETVRKQLKSALRKTGCENQEAMMVFLFENCIHYELDMDMKRAEMECIND